MASLVGSRVERKEDKSYCSCSNARTYSDIEIESVFEKINRNTNSKIKSKHIIPDTIWDKRDLLVV